jgi:hypothetical protein
MAIKSIISAVCTCLLIVTFKANAATISVDWKVTGDNLITSDTATGLNWLDLTETSGKSRDDVVTQLGTGGVYDGWRYATSSEVVTLWGNIGVDLNGADLSWPDDPFEDPFVLDAVNLLGNTTCQADCAGFPYGTLGLTGSQHPTDSALYDFIGAGYVELTFTTEYLGPGEGYMGTTDAGLQFGHYLVQTVPIPSAVWLFGSGLIGLIGLARRKA